MTGGILKARASKTLLPPALLDVVSRTRVGRMAMLGATLTAVLVYTNAMANGFVLDDRGVILSNPLVTSPASAWRAFAQPYWPEAVGGGQWPGASFPGMRSSSVKPPRSPHVKGARPVPRRCVILRASRTHSRFLADDHIDHDA